MSPLRLTRFHQAVEQIERFAGHPQIRERPRDLDDPLGAFRIVLGGFHVGVQRLAGHVVPATLMLERRQLEFHHRAFLRPAVLLLIKQEALDDGVEVMRFRESAGRASATPARPISDQGRRSEPSPQPAVHLAANGFPPAEKRDQPGPVPPS